jgi:hypothetical protein
MRDHGGTDNIYVETMEIRHGVLVLLLTRLELDTIGVARRPS